ncbi:uncharacterized protein with GYD domain [Rhodoligotrophos appendicifer]|uniref:GYD domain-containing protein n=1 Tax=Rhodoligotrophos appendicifer TaxID=987056 RepID=UPI001180DDA3|nr:GYD domain-containing protein [Rhodoligotrophos appendicifer]
MPYFISLMKFTEKGLREIKNTGDRIKISRDRVESVGGRSIQLFATLGSYDLVQIFEMPDDSSMMQYVMTARRDGYVDPLILPAFDESEWSSILEKIPETNT